MDNAIHVTRPSLPAFEEYVTEIRNIWDNYQMTNNGEKTRRFESELKRYLDIKNISLHVNGHIALESIIEALDLSGEIITTPFTFASTTHAIVRKGILPVFCDINFEDYTINTELLESKITEKTMAIVPVHVYGNICDVEEIERIAEKYGLIVIYDAAHAFGVRYKGKGIANFGNAVMFSFHATKVFNTIEGGAIATNDKELAEKLNCIKNFGITDDESVNYIGTNGKMNEFQAAMGICNLRHIDEEIEKRKAVVKRYRERFEGIKGIKLVKPQADVTSNYSYFPVVFDGYKYSRNEVYELLASNNIFTKKYFYPPTNSFACYKDRFGTSETPVASYVAERVLTLPLYAGLGLDDVDRICDIILK